MQYKNGGMSLSTFQNFVSQKGTTGKATFHGHGELKMYFDQNCNKPNI